MSDTTTTQAHIAYEVIENAKHQIVVIEFLSHEITSPARAALGEQLGRWSNRIHRGISSLIVRASRTLGSMAFSEIASFVHKACQVWVCNLDHALHLGAALVGLDNWAKFAADRRAAVIEAERTARWDEEDTVNIRPDHAQ